MPSFLEITSYIFFCNSCALGIFFEFSDYKRWIEKTKEFADVPSPIIPSLILLGQGLACLAVFVVLGSKFSLDFCWDKVFGELPFYQRVGYYYVAMTVKRFFYYSPFMISNGAVVACGLSYNGKDKEGNDKWDKIVSVYIIGVETADSCMTML